jgi:hypothetical protein
MINPNPLLALNHLTVFYFILESRERDRDGREKEDDVVLVSYKSSRKR